MRIINPAQSAVNELRRNYTRSIVAPKLFMLRQHTLGTELMTLTIFGQIRFRKIPGAMFFYVLRFFNTVPKTAQKKAHT